MSLEKTKKIIRDFLLNNCAEVLSIKGDWGVGKTYFWNEAINQAKDKPNFCREKYCYVSLFGITSIEQLKSMIFENLTEKTQIDKGFSIENLKQNIDKLVKQWGWRGITKSRKFFSFVRAPLNVEPWLFSLAFGLVQNTLICLDDFERKGDTLTAKEVLGLISHLKGCKCKIALILSDTNFDDESKQAFAQFREKVVDMEVRFSPTPAESAAVVFKTSSEIGTQLSTFTNTLQVSNIRVLQRIKRAADITVPLLRDFKPQITYAALQTLALFGWSFYSHTHDKKVPSYSYVTSFGYHFGGEKTEQQQGWDALLREYGFRATDKLDLALSSLIENGFIDEDLVRMEAEKLNQQIIATNSIDAFSEAWDIFYSFHNDDDEEKVVSTFESLLTKHLLFISPLNLNGVIELLRELNRDELVSKLIDLYVAARGNEKEIFNYSRNMLPFGIKPDEELTRKFNLKLASLEKTPTLESALAHIAQEQGWSSAQEEVLASATPDDFYRIFKSVTSKTLHSYIQATLRFGQWDGASDHQRAITKNAKKALLRISSESRINRIRVKRYGIYEEEPPSLPI